MFGLPLLPLRRITASDMIVMFARRILSAEMGYRPIVQGVLVKGRFQVDFSGIIRSFQTAVIWILQSFVCAALLCVNGGHGCD